MNHLGLFNEGRKFGTFKKGFSKTKSDVDSIKVEGEKLTDKFEYDEFGKIKKKIKKIVKK